MLKIHGISFHAVTAGAAACRTFPLAAAARVAPTRKPLKTYTNRTETQM
jgi:hypothetical protein